MVFEDLKKALSEVIMDLKPAPIPDEPVEFEMVTLDRSETDNSKWLSYLGIIVLFATAAEKGVFDRFVSEISEAKLITYSKFLMALLLAVPMLFFGNIAPKIPFNRYTGLRLPWTVRDEDTWIVAHRVLGYISAPIAILLFANVATDMPLDTYVKFWWLGAVILWIGIPGIISGVFYYKKWNGKL